MINTADNLARMARETLVYARYLHSMSSLYFCLSFCSDIIGIKYSRSDVVKAKSYELWDATCHMGSHIVTCHLTQANPLRVNRSHKADLPTLEGWKAE